MCGITAVDPTSHDTTLTTLVRCCGHELADEVPVPSIAPHTSSGILQRFELEPGFGKADFTAVCEQTLAIGRYQVSHCMALPSVTV